MKKYELMWIIGGNLDDNSADESLDKIKKLLNITSESKVISSSLWARRKLAYEIQNFDEGTYFISEIECLPSSIIKIENMFIIIKLWDNHLLPKFYQSLVIM